MRRVRQLTGMRGALIPAPYEPADALLISGAPAEDLTCGDGWLAEQDGQVVAECHVEAGDGDGRDLEPDDCTRKRLCVTEG
jgi:hypothetical protein